MSRVFYLFSSLTFLLCTQSLASELPEEIFFESSQIDACKEAASYTHRCFPSLGEFLRDKYYLPLHINSITPYERNSGLYAQEIARMLKEGGSCLDPTFVYFPEIIRRFRTYDIPVIIQSSHHSYLFKIRVVEPREGAGPRLLLFAFYNNLEFDQNVESPWNPTSSDEIGMAPLEVIRALQQHISIDSMICCSLGGICLDALKNIEEDFLPHTLILDRALTSTWKAGLSLFSLPKNYLLHLAVSYLRLYANPEKELVRFCQWSNEKRIVIIQAREDTYFSGKSALSPSFFQDLQKANVELYNGIFLIPFLSSRAQHSCRLDLLINNQASGSYTKNFLPMEKNGSVSDSLVKNLFLEKESHTCFIIGGSKENLDTMLYLHALPLLSSYCKLIK